MQIRPTALLMVILIVGCTPYYGPLQKLPDVSADNASELVIISDGGVSALGSTMTVGLNGREIFALAGNQYATFHIAAGTHSIIGKSGSGAPLTDKGIIELSSKPGERIYLHFLHHKFPLIYVEIVQLTEEQARPLMEKATRVGPQ